MLAPVARAPQYVPKASLDSSELFRKKAMDIAKSPASGLLMKAFMLYMVGSSINIFTIFAVFTAVTQPVGAIVAANTAFEGVEHGGVNLLAPKLLYILINLAGLGMGLYKLGACARVGGGREGNGAHWLACGCVCVQAPWACCPSPVQTGTRC